MPIPFLLAIGLMLTQPALAEEGALPLEDELMTAKTADQAMPAEYATEESPSSSPVGAPQRRTFYKLGEQKEVIAPNLAPTSSAPSQVDASAEIPPSAEEIPVVDGLVEEVAPEPEPLSEEELLVTPPVVEEVANTQSSDIPIPYLVLGAIAILGMAAYVIWRLIPRFKTTLSKEAIAPPPAAEGTYDQSAMVRLKTAMENEKK
ncbi:hypothetical protein FJZ27_05040 [Candidatus Peribacteria bacterium]|nr:hypothetical protein [Candidatus Peribacteria bacterium]